MSTAETTKLNNLWVPIEQTDFWGFRATGETLVEYRQFKADLQTEATAQIPVFTTKIIEFFGLQQYNFFESLPIAFVTDTVAGGSASHSPGENAVYLPVKYALPKFMKDVEDLRQTQFYSVLGHELGHYVLLSALAQGDVSNFMHIYLYELDKLYDEFFARICQRLICEELNMFLTTAKKSDFSKEDCHRSFVNADRNFLQISQLQPDERTAFAFDPTLLRQFIQKKLT